jgi:hypothetical protein
VLVWTNPMGRTGGDENQRIELEYVNKRH